MPKITYIEHDGTEHTVDMAAGLTVMEGAVNNGIPGIEGDCGGACACSTCHVYVDEKWLSTLKPAEEMEVDMLDFAYEPNERSRLGCQLTVTAEMDGMIVKMPKKQL